MKRSLHITIVTIGMGLLLIPAVIQAQPDQAAKNNPTIEYLQGFQDIFTDKHSFIVKLHDEISSILEKFRSKITGNGGRFEGNTKCGCFQGKSVLGLIKGEYRSISDTEVEITIKDKPFTVPYKTIESKIKEHLS
jgi:hypothetical protein